MAKSIINSMRPWTTKDFSYFCDCDTKEKFDERLEVIKNSNRYFSNLLIMWLYPHMGEFAGNNLHTIWLAEAMEKRNRQLKNPFARLAKNTASIMRKP